MMKGSLHPFRALIGPRAWITLGLVLAFAGPMAIASSPAVLAAGDITSATLRRHVHVNARAALS
jgi:hypothetical protein